MKQDNKETSSLLVIGNGFDLHCGLRSTFSAYYDSECYKVLDDFYCAYFGKEYRLAMKIVETNKDIINIWSLIFYIQYHSRDVYFQMSDNKSTNWFDIEKLIALSFQRDFDNGYSLKYSVHKGLGLIGKVYDIDKAKDQEIKINPYIFLPFAQGVKYESDINYLIDELHKFENSFKNYISKEQSRQIYQNTAIAFLDKLIEGDKKVDILNFNYTIIGQNKKVNNQTNIHGSVNDNEIILGIDSNEVTQKEYNCFTKTYRDLHRVKEVIELPDNVDKIYFYGHSLADADFSYFYSLFDMYDLYSGSLMLVFLYSDYSPSEEENEHNHNIYVNRVFELINKYSETSKKENNLLHRLLLEGRIVIKKVE